MFVREALESKAIAGAFAALQMQNHVLANHPLAGAYGKLKVFHPKPANYQRSNFSTTRFAACTA